MVRLMLRIARALGLFALARRACRGQLRILCYHGIWTGGAPHYGDCLFMSAGRFAARMRMLEASGCDILSLDEALQRLDDGSLPAFPVVITIDDAWSGTQRHMLPELARRRWPATLYVTSYYPDKDAPVINVMLGYLFAHIADLPEARATLKRELPELDLSGVGDADGLVDAVLADLDTMDSMAARMQRVRCIAAALGLDVETCIADRRFHLMSAEALADACRDGVDLQLHTHRHRMYDFDATRLGDDLATNRAWIASRTGCDPARLRHFCYPSGVHDEAAFATLRAAGVVSATTTDFGLVTRASNRMALPRILDCESLEDIELEARLSGFWSLLRSIRRRPS